MSSRLSEWVESLYERVLKYEISETPTHVAVIQDGNRRYASRHGDDPTDGHRAGAETTEALLDWCDELGIQEVTLYTFSTENFNRPEDEREELFDLIASKLREFADADRVHEEGVRIRTIGETDRLPARVRDAIAYAEGKTSHYDQLYLNIALAYGGRAELLRAAREIASDVDAGDINPDDIDVGTVDSALYDGPTHSVDLIIRSGGDERTSNFLPWQANGNEAAVYFSTPYWPEFRKVDFLRGIRTYEHREESWRQTRAQRARELIQALGSRADTESEHRIDAIESRVLNDNETHPETPDPESESEAAD
jgi:tritrans,polycis-undecaprenyl-diphosphate synthase [geranylgeranyl-diphosphate specific]